MEQFTAQRQLVKSPPELWAEVSDEDALGRRLAQFGEIRITRVEPETTVAWEGDRASGTVQLAATGWGTKVTLTAMPAAVLPQHQEPELERDVPALEVEASPTHEPEPELAPAARGGGFFARLFRRRSKPVDLGPPAPGPQLPPPAPASRSAAPAAPAPAVVAAERTAAVLDEVLDDLGAAHHRPFSRD
jgi:hypothetical protein